MRPSGFVTTRLASFRKNSERFTVGMLPEPTQIRPRPQPQNDGDRLEGRPVGTLAGVRDAGPSSASSSSSASIEPSSDTTRRSRSLRPPQTPASDDRFGDGPGVSQRQRRTIARPRLGSSAPRAGNTCPAVRAFRNARAIIGEYRRGSKAGLRRATATRTAGSRPRLMRFVMRSDAPRARRRVQAPQPGRLVGAAGAQSGEDAGGGSVRLRVRCSNSPTLAE